MKFTLDNNCLIAVENGEPEAPDIIALVDAHRAGRAEVAVLGIGASERQRGGGYLANIGDYLTWLGNLGLQGLTVLKPTGIFDVTFWDWSDYATPSDLALERRIHDALFPPSDFNWASLAASAREAVTSTTGPAYRKWRNRRCDVQGMLAHIRNGREVFVTNDRRLLDRAASLQTLGAKQVMAPSDAVALIP